MNEESNPLNDVMIASPCNIGWENMEGTDKVRFCGSCQLNVYNTSQMSKKEVVELLAGGSASCLRIYRRADGTMLTEDCPVGLRKIRDAARRVRQIAASFWALVISCSSVFAQSSNKTDSTPLKPGPIQIIDGNFIVAPDKVKGQTGTVESKSKEGAADTSALKNLEKARASALKKNSKDAERFFKAATASLTKSKHDPAFEKLVWLEYADFLTAENRLSEAKAIRSRPEFAGRPEPKFTLGERLERVPTQPLKKPAD